MRTAAVLWRHTVLLCRAAVRVCVPDWSVCLMALTFTNESSGVSHLSEQFLLISMSAGRASRSSMTSKPRNWKHAPPSWSDWFGPSAARYECAREPYEERTDLITRSEMLRLGVCARAGGNGARAAGRRGV